MFPKINSNILNAMNIYNQQGLLQFLKRVLGKLGFEHFSHSFIFLILDMNDIPDHIDIPYKFQIATIDDIQNDHTHHYGYFTKEETLDRIKKGHRLFLYKEKEQPVFTNWVEQRNACIDRFRMPLNIPTNMIYTSGLYTAPAYRNKGIATNIRKSILHYLKKTGVQYALSVIEPNNLIARQVNKRLGYKEYQLVNYRRYWHIRRYTVHKCNSGESKTFTTIFKAPEDLWKIFL